MALLVHTPLLLDQSLPGTTRTASLFIVSEEVPGVAISSLLKQRLQEDVSLSHVLVLRVLSGLFFIARARSRFRNAWNDVKMEHIFGMKPTENFHLSTGGMVYFCLLSP